MPNFLPTCHGQGMSWDARLREQKHEAAEERIQLEEVIRKLQRQLREHGMLAAIPVLLPPHESQTTTPQAPIPNLNTDTNTDTDTDTEPQP